MCLVLNFLYLNCGFVVNSVTVFVNLIFVDFVTCGRGLLVGSGLRLVY